jgi:hypothetical protein
VAAVHPSSKTEDLAKMDLGAAKVVTLVARVPAAAEGRVTEMTARAARAGRNRGLRVVTRVAALARDLAEALVARQPRQQPLLRLPRLRMGNQ